MKKILIVEDDNSIRENLAELLELNNFDVYTASNGESGIMMAKEILPILILCDIMMPGKDGYVVKEELHKNEKTELIPFIFLTAKSEIKDIRKGMILGADDYIVKPYEKKELLDSIFRRIEKNEKLKKHLIKEQNFGDKKNTKSKFSIDDKIIVTVNNEPKLINLKNIIFIKADRNYTNVFSEGEKRIMVRKLIKNWEEILPSHNFIRINQSIIINLEYVKKIEKLSNRSFILKLRNIENPFTVSQRYTSKIKIRFQV